jgi:hypothetical protein
LATALVLAFDARKTIFGRLTLEQPGLVVRAMETPELRARSRFQVEMRGGSVDVAALFMPRLDVAVTTTSQTADSWSGWIEFKVPGQLEGLPIMRAVREVREKAARALVQFEAGAGTIRLDLKERPADPVALLGELRRRLLANGLVATIHIEEFTDGLESWNPKRPILP